MIVTCVTPLSYLVTCVTVTYNITLYFLSKLKKKEKKTKKKINRKIEKKIREKENK